MSEVPLWIFLMSEVPLWMFPSCPAQPLPSSSLGPTYERPTPQAAAPHTPSRPPILGLQ